MKMKTLVILLALLVLPISAPADRITLDDPEVLSTPEATHLEWFISKIDAQTNTLQVTYRWRDVDDGAISLGRRTDWNIWTCRDIETPGENSECLDVDDPWDCCTGLGTGDCDGLDDDCFNSVFGFQIRAQDVDTGIGVGLRTLIWNKMKLDVLTGGNDGTFD
jgi:hypothetical protein